jgi:predicted HicB family RNase H-like nuclease
VPIELPDDELFQLMRMAHERDITLNQLVEEALRLAIENMETV